MENQLRMVNYTLFHDILLIHKDRKMFPDNKNSKKMRNSCW